MLLFLRNDEVRSTEGPFVSVQGRLSTGTCVQVEPRAHASDAL